MRSEPPLGPLESRLGSASTSFLVPEGPLGEEGIPQVTEDPLLTDPSTGCIQDPCNPPLVRGLYLGPYNGVTFLRADRHTMAMAHMEGRLPW